MGEKETRRTMLTAAVDDIRIHLQRKASTLYGDDDQRYFIIRGRIRSGPYDTMYESDSFVLASERFTEIVDESEFAKEYEVKPVKEDNNTGQKRQT